MTKKRIKGIPNPVLMTSEYLKCRANLNLEVDFKHFLRNGNIMSDYDLGDILVTFLHLLYKLFFF